jgi:hypothetical protein
MYFVNVFKNSQKLSYKIDSVEVNYMFTTLHQKIKPIILKCIGNFINAF